jgi:hypothetical protein
MKVQPLFFGSLPNSVAARMPTVRAGIRRRTPQAALTPALSRKREREQDMLFFDLTSSTEDF